MKKNRTKRILSMLLTLCMVLTLVPMTAFAADTYTLTIVNGVKAGGGGETSVVCAAGSEFDIKANEAPEGKVFDKWVSTVHGALTSPGNSTTWFKMPAQDVTVTATYKNEPETDTELSNIKVIAYKSGWQNPALTPAFDRETRSYALNLTAEYNSIYFYLGKQATEQTITATVDGVALTGTPSETGFQTDQHTLTKATTVFVFTITAKDGSTTGTYTVTVNRGSGITHAVTVTGGTTATPTPAEGDTVTITANEPAPGKVFDKWTTTDGVAFANANSATTTFVMPTKAVTVTATYKNNPETDTELKGITVNAYKSGWQNPALTPAFDRETRSYALNLTAEYNSIYFYLGKQATEQTITATVDGVALTGTPSETGFQTDQHTLTKATTVFVFTITAKDGSTTGTYTVTVNRGSGITHAVTVTGGTTATPTPAEGDTVTITANEPAPGKVFDKWTTTDGVAFANANSATTTFVMPTKAVTVTATYKNNPETDTELSNIIVYAYTSVWENPALTPAFDRETRSYALNLTSEYKSIYFNLAKQATGQTIIATVDGNPLAVNTAGSDFQTTQHALAKATTVFVFTITAKDGSTTGTYTVTVNRGSGITHAVTVTGGTTATPTPAEGDTVTIKANEPAPGKVFDKWTTTDGVAFANANSATTTFVMPTKAVTVTATYKNNPETDTELSNIIVNAYKSGWQNPALTPAFDRETISYSLNLIAEYNLIYFYLGTQVEGQTITATVDGNALEVNTAVNGFETAQHTLTKATTVFVFTVTAKDSITTDTYTVTVNRLAATVDSIAVNSTTHKTVYKVGEALDVSNLTVEATMSDSTKQTINVTSDMVTGFNSSAVAESQTLTITYEGKTTTYTISIGKADGPAAPTGLVGVKPTTVGGSDGKITGTTSLMEYATDSAFSSPTDCTGTEITGLSAGTYYVRVKETATHKAGAYATVTVPAGSTATVDSIAVNSTTHKTVYKVGEALDVSNLTVEATMSDSTKQTINVTSDMVTGFNSSAVAESQTLTITYEGKTTTYTISIGKADGPAAPTGLVGVKPTTVGGSDGKITGTTSLMEYATDSAFSSPTDCTGTEITGLSAGTYYVRVKETATHKAGAYATVTVPAGSTATVDSIAVNSTTHKTVYKVGEALDVSNLTVEATMSDSTKQTINVTSDMVTGFNSSAVAESQTLTITYEGKTTTYTISIGKADGPAAPTGLVGVKPTTVGGSDGKITGTTSLMEYATDSAFSSPTDCTGTEITGLSAGTYYVRVKETATHKAGAYATVTVPAGSTATVDSIAVNSTTHKTVYKVGEALDVSNLTVEATMSDSTKQTINVTSDMVTGFNSSAVAESQTLTITYEGKTTTYTISIGKADGPAAPTGLVGVKPTTVGGSDGKITGTTSLMEYATDSAFSSPTDCTGTEITGLSAGTYYVRVKETATHKAGAYATVTVPAGSTATVDSIAVNSTTHKTVYKVGEALDVSNLTIVANMSDSSTQTINVTSAMVTGFGSSAVAESQTLTITYEGKTTTYTISIGKADGPAAPTGLVGVKPTTVGGSDGKITGTTSLMEYATDSAFSSPTDCTGTEITGLSAGTYYVRVKETATHKAGAYATVTVPAGSTATVDSIAVNSTTHKTVYKVGEALDVSNLTIVANMSDSSTQTINVTSAMVTGFGSSAVAESQTLTITYEGKTTTYTISIGKADGPAAPTGLVGVKPTTVGGSDGKITGTTSLMEYATDSAFSSPTDCTGTEITGLSAGTYYVRVKETATHKAGAYATVTVPAGSTATVDSIAVNSTTHKTVYKVGEALDVSNLTVEATMSDSTKQTINVTSDMVTGFNSSAVAESQTLTITYEGKTTTYTISIGKADGPAAPTGLVGVKPTTVGGSDGKITGTTSLMEYATDSAFSSPTDCTGTEITGLSAGTYYVRVKETATHKAGAYATVTVPAGSTATYTVTVSSGGTSATGSGSYTAGTTINIYAGSRSGYTFTGWTSSDVTITNASSKNASFTMPAKNVTVTANWSYSGGGGGGGSSSTSTIQPTVPAANGSIQVNYTASGGTAVLTLPGSKVDEIIARSKDGEVDIDLSKMGGITSAELPKTALTAINEAGLDVTVKFPAGSITLKKDATVSIVGQAEGGSLKLELKQVAKRSLTDEQKEAVKSNDLVLDINISSGTKKISSFDGTLSITVPYSGPQPVAVWYLNDKGELEKLFCTFVDGTVSFNLDHLSLYVVGQDTAWVNPFADAKESDWFYGSVEYAFKNGLMVGTSDTTFSPYMNTTRGMIVTILHRLEGRPKSDAANAFTDVGADKYYTDAVAWARDNIIVSGYGNGMFGPEDSITREQMAAILMNYAKYKGYDISMKADLSKFADGESISPWAKDAISWANAEGLIQGSGSHLMPVDNALRCQVAAILQRFIETIAK